MLNVSLQGPEWVCWRTCLCLQRTTYRIDSELYLSPIPKNRPSLSAFEFWILFICTQQRIRYSVHDMLCLLYELITNEQTNTQTHINK